MGGTTQKKEKKGGQGMEAVDTGDFDDECLNRQQSKTTPNSIGNRHTFMSPCRGSCEVLSIADSHWLQMCHKMRVFLC